MSSAAWKAYDGTGVVELAAKHAVNAIRGPVPEVWGGDPGLSLWHPWLRWAVLLGAAAAGQRLAGCLGVAVAVALFATSCTLWWWREATGWLDTVLFMLADTMLPAVKYSTEVYDAADEESYAIWWCTRSRGATLWVAVPGGMSDGESNCQQSCMRAVAALPSTDACVFHMPGQGGTKIKARFGPGLCDTSYLMHFLQKLSAGGKYKCVIVIGLSAGGMVCPNLCSVAGKQSFSFKLRAVSLGGPDYIRHTFEDQSSTMYRLDIFFTLWFYVVTRRSGLVEMLPKEWSFPWRPTWDGYMKPASACAMSLGCDKPRNFEELEQEHFSGCARTVPPIPYLRIHGANDPVVRPRVLFEAGLRNIQTWWTPRGGHCGQWRTYPKLAAAISSWAQSC